MGSVRRETNRKFKGLLWEGFSQITAGRESVKTPRSQASHQTILLRREGADTGTRRRKWNPGLLCGWFKLQGPLGIVQLRAKGSRWHFQLKTLFVLRRSCVQNKSQNHRSIAINGKKSQWTKFRTKSEQSRAGDFGDLAMGTCEIPITQSVFSG